ncbi:MAG: hypothetical protein ABJA84_04160 [Polaromonas sp.]
MNALLTLIFSALAAVMFVPGAHIERMQRRAMRHSQLHCTLDSRTRTK